MRGRSMKKIILLFVIMSILFSGCGKEEIIGNWVSSDKLSSVSFDEKGTIVINGKYIGNYSVYDDGKMAINVDTDTFDEVYDITMSAEYKIKDDILYIIDSEEQKTYRYYSDKKVKLLINEKYQKIYDEKESEQYMPYTISYPDEWELNLDGTELEGIVSSQELQDGSEKARAMVEDEIIILYKSSVINDEFIFVCACDSAVYVWDSVCYEISVGCVDMIGDVCTYVVNPENGDIFVYDEDGFLVRWNGTIKGSSILKYI